MIFSLTTHAVTKASVVRRKRARINIPDDIPRATHLRQTATPPGAPRGGEGPIDHTAALLLLIRRPYPRGGGEGGNQSQLRSPLEEKQERTAEALAWFGSR